MPRRFRHLNLSERAFIEVQLSLGMRPAGIAVVLKRARSTISREMRRNRWRAHLRKGSRAGGYAVRRLIEEHVGWPRKRAGGAN